MQATLSLHRSIIFWSGLLVIAFTSWAWWDSLHHAARLKCGSSMVASASGGVMLFHLPRTGTGLVADYSHQSFLVGPHLDAVQKAFFLRGTDKGTIDTEYYYRDVEAAGNAQEVMRLLMGKHRPDAWLLFIPYWLILLGFAIFPWGALLVERARRRKRSRNLAEAISAAS